MTTAIVLDVEAVMAAFEENTHDLMPVGGK